MSPEDLKNLAHAYGELAEDLVAWRATNPIADEELGEKYDSQVADLVGKSDKLESLAVTSALANLQTSVADLRAATHKAKHALEVIKDVTTALAIGAAAVGAVASLLAPTVTAGAVADALDGLAQAIQKATPTKPDGKGEDGDDES